MSRYEPVFFVDENGRYLLLRISSGGNDILGKPYVRVTFDKFTEEQVSAVLPEDARRASNEDAALRILSDHLGKKRYIWHGDAMYIEGVRIPGDVHFRELCRQEIEKKFLRGMSDDG